MLFGFVWVCLGLFGFVWVCLGLFGLSCCYCLCETNFGLKAPNIEAAMEYG
jgi:hypothetical protein